jgi:AraC-like DNA-binding protein/Tfp pilus assembly protein PilF
LFEKALEIDDKHVESYVGLADAYGFLATTELMTREEGWIKAVENTHKAYALDPKNAGVHYQLANLAFFTDFNYASAFEHTLKSLEYKPNYPEAQQFMTFLYMLDGKYEKAKQHLQLALAIDPLSHETKFYQAYYYYRTGDYIKALELFDELIEINPKNIPAIITRIYTLFLMKEYAKIENYLDHIPQEILIPDEMLGMRCLLHIRSNNKSENKYLPLLIKAAENQTSFQAHSYLFLSYANMKEYDKAFDFFEKAIKMKSSVLLLSFSDPLAGEIKNEKRYNEYQAKIYALNKHKKIESKKKTQLLDDNTAELTLHLLEKHFENEKPYLNPTLTLKDLASQIDIHPNQLSWLINEKLGNKFNAYINSYRLEYFKELAQNPKNSNISIIGLAYESGFNSKTVFNTFFKKTTGITPFEYLKQLQEN